MDEPDALRVDGFVLTCADAKPFSIARGYARNCSFGEALMLFLLSSTISRGSIRVAAATAVCALIMGSAAAAPYQSYKTTTCASAATCFVNFPAAPAGQRLVITNVACRYTFPASSVLTSADLVTNGSGVRDILMPVGISAVFGGESVYAANNPTLFHVPPGSTVRAQATINPAGNIAMVCKIAGTSEAP